MKLTYTENIFIGTDASEILYTPIRHINDAIDDSGITPDSEVLGLWTYELEDKSTIYYTVIGEDIVELIAYKDCRELKYIINMNNQIIACIPEDGDIIYDTYKEAKLQTLSKDKINSAL